MYFVTNWQRVGLWDNCFVSAFTIIHSDAYRYNNTYLCVVAVHFVLKNESSHLLSTNGSTKISGQIDTPLADIHPGVTKDFLWRNHGGETTGVSGVVHYTIGSTSMVLNIMASAAPNFNIRDAVCNIRVCDRSESFSNLSKGKNGCQPPTKAGNRRKLDGCEYILFNYNTTELRVTFKCDGCALTCDGRAFSCDGYAQTSRSCSPRESDVLKFILNNESPHVLQAIGSTKCHSLLDTPLPDIMPGKQKEIEWNRYCDILKDRCGVLHYHIGETGMILNVMTQIGVTYLLSDTRVNARVCNWRESYKNLHDGSGGCFRPESGGYRQITMDGCTFHLSRPKSTSYRQITMDDCTFHLSTSQGMLLRVTYTFVDVTALPISRALSTNIIDAHYEHGKCPLYWICVIVNKSKHNLIADGHYEKEGCLETAMEHIQPNYTKLLVCRGKIVIFGASAALYYKIGTTKCVLSIMAAIQYKKNVALCNVHIGSRAVTFRQLYNGSDDCRAPSIAGTASRHSSCDFVMSGRKRATLIVVFNGNDVPDIVAFDSNERTNKRRRVNSLAAQGDEVNYPTTCSELNRLSRCKNSNMPVMCNQSRETDRLERFHATGRYDPFEKCGDSEVLNSDALSMRPAKVELSERLDSAETYLTHQNVGNYETLQPDGSSTRPKGFGQNNRFQATEMFDTQPELLYQSDICHPLAIHAQPEKVRCKTFYTTAPPRPLHTKRNEHPISQHFTSSYTPSEKCGESKCRHSLAMHKQPESFWQDESRFMHAVAMFNEPETVRQNFGNPAYSPVMQDQTRRPCQPANSTEIQDQPDKCAVNKNRRVHTTATYRQSDRLNTSELQNVTLIINQPDKQIPSEIQNLTVVINQPEIVGPSKIEHSMAPDYQQENNARIPTSCIHATVISNLSERANSSPTLDNRWCRNVKTIRLQ